IPILAFMLGVFIAEKIRKYFTNNKTKIHWRQVIIIIEMITILIVSFIPRGRFNMFVNVAISFICSMQVESFRKVNGNSFATTMCTGNLRSATETLFHYIHTKNIFMIKKSLQYYAIIIFFISGAILGTFFTKIFVEKSILICFFILAVVFGIMFINKDDSFNEN
ncbi:YoaK family protein, partial [Clostridioides difficile]